MGDPGDGWHTVMPTSHSAMGRLSHAQLDEVERQILREWEAARGHWSGIGKHTPLGDTAEAKKLHARFKADTILGSGSFGVVEKVKYTHNSRSIYLARKAVRPPNRRHPLQLLREEANVMERLDHEHIVKVIGSYFLQGSLNLLLWPVAICNLDSLLTDLDCLRTNRGDREDILGRLHALDLREPHARMGNGTCPLEYLRQIMGCITRAVAYCHDANIRHLDLKPSNILLNPGRVYLADFGIAKDVHDRDHTMTRGQMGTPKWRAPELHQIQSDWSMKAADVYSLGLILVNIATVVHDAPLEEFDAMLGELNPKARADKLQAFLRKLEGHALATQEVDDINAPTFAPKHIVNLVSRMVASDPSSRPVILNVDAEMVDLGGIDQIYHFQCCKKSSRYVTERMNAKFKDVLVERDRLRSQHGDMAKQLEALKGKDATYESRILNERKTHADNIAKLQAQLEKERTERKRLEALVGELQRQDRRHHHRPGIPRPVSDRQVSGGSPGLEMRPARPRTQPPPGPAVAPQRPPPPQFLAQPSPLPPTGPSSGRLSYSQTAAAAAASLSTTTKPSPHRRDSLIPSPLPTPAHIPLSRTNTNSPHPSPIPSPGNPDATASTTAGYPLRSRTSGSRLPRAVNPATPIRSNTPVLHRDPSSTDSTQYSMASSVFSSVSVRGLSASRGSLGEGSVLGVGSAVGTPGRSPGGVGGKGKEEEEDKVKDRDGEVETAGMSGKTALPGGGGESGHDGDEVSHAESALTYSPETVATGKEEETVHGLGLGLTDPPVSQDEHADDHRREFERRSSITDSHRSITTRGSNAMAEQNGMRDTDTASVAGSVSATSGRVPPLSPLLSASSVVSSTSPRMTHASLASGRGAMAMVVPPSLPTERSWADVARRDQGQPRQRLVVQPRQQQERQPQQAQQQQHQRRV